MWAQLRAEVAGQPAPKPAPVVAEPAPVVVQPAPVSPAPVAPAPAMVEPVVKPVPQPVTAVVETKKVSKLWSKVVFANNTPVGGGSWIFSLDGEQLSTGEVANAGQPYFLVDPQEYTNFVPKSWKDLGELQFPGTKLEREGDFGARFVNPVGPWKKPSGKNFVVHYNSAVDRPAGYIIEGVFTGWVLPK